MCRRTGCLDTPGCAGAFVVAYRLDELVRRQPLAVAEFAKDGGVVRIPFAVAQAEPDNDAAIAQSLERCSDGLVVTIIGRREIFLAVVAARTRQLDRGAHDQVLEQDSRPTDVFGQMSQAKSLAIS